MRIKKPPDPLDQQIGRNIRFHRMRRPLSQTALGEQIAIAYQQVQKYETAANRVPASRLVRIARVLEVPVGALLADDAEDRSGEPLNRLYARQSDRLARAIAKITDDWRLSLIVELAELVTRFPD
jgi:transcriptional regulator with XRE-family HTH domain